MEIVFTKLTGNRHAIEVRGRRGPDLRRPPRETGPTIPHDLVHAVVEQALGIDDGFWTAVAAGVTYEDFEPVSGRHKRAGVAEKHKRDERVMAAELAVSWAHRAWSGQRTEGRGLGTPPLDAAQLARAGVALDDALARWRALPEGGALVWRFEG